MVSECFCLGVSPSYLGLLGDVSADAFLYEGECVAAIL